MSFTKRNAAGCIDLAFKGDFFLVLLFKFSNAPQALNYGSYFLFACLYIHRVGSS